MATVIERHRERAREFLALRMKFDMGDPVASLAALLAEVEAEARDGKGQDEMFADALRMTGEAVDETPELKARIAALEAALRSCARMGNANGSTTPVRRLVNATLHGGSDSALKDMLVRAVRAGVEEGEAYSIAQEAGVPRGMGSFEAIVERVMRGE